MSSIGNQQDLTIVPGVSYLFQEKKESKAAKAAFRLVGVTLDDVSRPKDPRIIKTHQRVQRRDWKSVEKKVA